MKKRLLIVLSALSLGSPLFAAQPITGYVQINPPNAPQPGGFNTQSGQVQTLLVTGNSQFTKAGLIPGQCLGLDGSNNTVTYVCGGGGGGAGGSSLGVNFNGVLITSPTSALNFLGPPFKVASVSAGTTAQFTLDPSSVTLYGTSLPASAITGTLSTGNLPATVAITNAINTFTATQLFPSNIIVSSGSTAYFSNGHDFEGLGLASIQNTGGTGTNNILTITSGNGIVLASSVTLSGKSNSLLAVDANGIIISTPAFSGILPIANGGTGTSSPNLLAGSNVTITGAWPNQTINSTGGGGGSGSGAQVNVASQFSVPFYSASGSSNTLSGSANFSYNQTTVTVVGAVTASTITASNQLLSGSNYFQASAIANGLDGFTHWYHNGSCTGEENTNGIAVGRGYGCGTHNGAIEGDDTGATGAGGYFTINGTQPINYAVRTINSAAIANGVDYGISALANTNHTGTNFGAFLSAEGISASNFGLWVDSGSVQIQSSMTVVGAMQTQSTMTAAAYSSSGSGNMVVTVPQDANTYQVTGTSVAPAVGQCAVFTSSWTLQGQSCGSGGGTPAAPLGSVQYNGASSFAAIPGSFVGTSSITFSTMGVTGPLTLFGPNPANFFSTTLSNTLVSLRFFQSGVDDNTISFGSSAGMTIPFGTTFTNTNSPILARTALISAPSAASPALTAPGIVDLWAVGATSPYISWSETGVANDGTMGWIKGGGHLKIYSGSETFGSGTELLDLSNAGSLTIDSTATVKGQFGAIDGSATDTQIVRFSTAATGPYAVDVSTTNHLNFQDFTSSPTLSGCGTGPSFFGSDNSMTITPGSTAAGCTVTFGRAYVNTPVCIVADETMSLVNALAYTVTKTAITITQTSLTSKLDIHCFGRD